MIYDEEEASAPQVGAPGTDAFDSREQLDLGDGVVAFVLREAPAVVADYSLVPGIVLLGQNASQSFRLRAIGFNHEEAVEAGHTQDDWLGGH